MRFNVSKESIKGTAQFHKGIVPYLFYKTVYSLITHLSSKEKAADLLDFQHFCDFFLWCEGGDLNHRKPFIRMTFPPFQANILYIHRYFASFHPLFSYHKNKSVYLNVYLIKTKSPQPFGFSGQLGAFHIILFLRYQLRNHLMQTRAAQTAGQTDQHHFGGNIRPVHPDGEHQT